jgi:hypothetical protein
MPAIIGVLIDVDDNKPGDGEVGDDRDKVGPALIATAVPVKFGFTNSQTFHRVAHFLNVSVVT